MKKFLFILVLGLLIPAFASAEEISRYNVKLNIQADASVNVQEEIEYDFGNEQRHGIYRYIPIKYRARGGNFSVSISDVKVVDEKGKSYRFKTSRKGSDLYIKIGDPDAYVTGKKIYKINYNIDRAINYFDAFDELYWNATGNGWDVPIKAASAEVFLPTEVNRTDLKLDCFAGQFGSQQTCEMPVSQNIIFKASNLLPQHGLTIAVGFPKGIVSKPTRFEQALNILKDNYILGLPLLALVVMYLIWRKYGKDPDGKGIIITEFDAPDNLTPAEIGTLIDENADNKDLSSDIINLAVRGYLKITKTETHGLLITSDDYNLQQLKPAKDSQNDHEKLLMNALFDVQEQAVAQKIVLLSSLKKNVEVYKRIQNATKDVYETLVEKGYFVKNPKTVRGLYVGVGAVVIFVLIYLSGFFGSLEIASVILTAIIVISFGYHMPARTKKGVLAREHILGLKNYLTVAEKDRINFHNAPEKNPQQFEKLLPFAMALGVEKEWAKQFEGIYTGNPSWYSDGTQSNFAMTNFMHGIGGFKSEVHSAIRTGAAAARGGSGSGGGGFSGGGFGGGGGGSW